jgi:D-alanyl-D-alanine carboxypeptidase
MPSSFLAFIFVAVMVVITWVNHLRETPAPANIADVAGIVAVVAEPNIAPSPIPDAPPEFSSYPLPLTPLLPAGSEALVVRPSLHTPGNALPQEQDRALLPQITARAYILTDETGAVLAGRNLAASLHIASLTKLMTAVVFKENFAQGGSLEILEHTLALNRNAFGLDAEDKISKKEALEFMLIVSSNIAAESAAEALGRDVFLKKMNAKAAELGMTGTYFVDASGLGDFNRSSVRDIARFMKYIAAVHPDILVISRSPSALFQGNVLINTNELLGRAAGIIGAKTGYTDAAGECLAVVFERNNRKFYAVILGSKDRAADMYALMEYAGK